MRLEIPDPTDSRRRAVAGFDPALGCFVEVRERGRRLAEYDGLTARGGSTVDGVLQVLVAHGFFSEDDVDEAIAALPHELPEEIEEPSVRCVAMLVVGLRRAAAG